MYSLFDLDIGAVIRESADRIIETLDIQAGTDRTDDERVDTNDESTLDFIEVEVCCIFRCLRPCSTWATVAEATEVIVSIPWRVQLYRDWESSCTGTEGSSCTGTESPAVQGLRDQLYRDYEFSCTGSKAWLSVPVALKAQLYKGYEAWITACDSG
jgi:hypothetical protein